MGQGRILVDTDAGVDDLLALYVLSRLLPASTIALAATYGNVSLDQAVCNVSILVGVSGVRPHVVFRGSAAPLHTDPHFALDVHGEDGIGGASRMRPWSALPELATTDLFKDRNTADYERIIAIGPLSDIAIIAKREHHQPPLFVMGGAFDVRGNISRFSEFNFYSDPDAASTVFDSYDGDIFVIPLDVCRQVVLTRSHLGELCDLNPSLATSFLKVIHQHYMDYYRRVEGIDGCYPHDTICVFAALFSDMFSWERGYVQIIRSGADRGRSVFRKKADANRFVARTIDLPRFLALLESAIAQ
jgi:purine nucleosidase